MPTAHPPAYLVEILVPTSTETLETDLHANLGVAVERVFSHFSARGVSLSVEVSYAADSELEGMAFFDKELRLVACLTVYRLDRDHDEVANPQVSQALALPEPARSVALNKLFAC